MSSKEEFLQTVSFHKIVAMPLTILLVLFTQTAYAQNGVTAPNQWFIFFGHFHALAVHLPIGFLLLAGLMEGFLLINKKIEFGFAISFSLILSAASSLMAALFGYMLSLDGGYGEDLLNTHMWLGILLTICSFILLYLKVKKMNARIYYPFLTLSIILLSATGHYGGSLTHGENYLNKDMPSSLKLVLGMDVEAQGVLVNVTSIGEAKVFPDIIQPILDDKCVSCHNTSKSKGNLRMHNLEALLAGGESGMALVPMQPEKSLMIKHINLPLEQEEHMPPKGKPQLTPEESTLLDWWVTAGASAEATVADLEKPPVIDDILKKMGEKMAKKTNPVFAKTIKPADQDDLEDASNNSLAVYPLTAASPFLHIRVDQKEIESLDDYLNPFIEQLVSLDLSRTNSTDQTLKEIADLKHLTKLYLQNTQITDKGLAYLKDLKYLEYLNLYGTSISDEGLSQLAELKQLKNLFVWKTQVSEEAIMTLTYNLPDLVVEQGIDIALLDTVRLAKPFIETERPIFKDTTQIKLSLGIEHVAIYYTLDGTEPTENSNIYTSPINITSSCTVKAIAIKEGWRPSHPSMLDLTKVKFLIQSVQLHNQPNEQYNANGSISLIDSRRGSEDFRDNQWLGFHEVDLTAQLDMGKPIEMEKITLGCFEDISAYIFFPTKITVSYSNDGIRYKNLTAKSFSPSKGNRPSSIKNFQLDFNPIKAKYIKIVASSMGRCPDWHPAAGDKAWLFVDEVIVE